MRNQRHSKVHLHFEDTLHNINNSKVRKKDVSSGKGTIQKDHRSQKESNGVNKGDCLNGVAIKEDGDKWTSDIGISAMASSLGKPLLMGPVTANMCHKGIGNIGYARVLIGKEIKNEIENQYVDKSNNVKGRSTMMLDLRSRTKYNMEGSSNATNKYSILESLPEDNVQELLMLNERMIVDKFLNDKVQPTLQELITWSKDMIKYFREKWELDRLKDKGTEQMDDVVEGSNGTSNIMRDNVVNGIEGGVLNEDSYGF
ncbi:hypothetical protein Tco_1257661 [Tanacetum coccineum]